MRNALLQMDGIIRPGGRRGTSLRLIRSVHTPLFVWTVEWRQGHASSALQR
jgi:hypothetical protein